MQSDRRQIQTAVLGSVDSEEPLLLPLEAIELDSFRHRHEHDTFWCGLLLGGCGGQLTTKLYTDRVCHFAHHPDPDGLPQVCGRHARGVASADHLYVKSAAAAWLHGRGEQARFDYPQPDGAPIGSVVDIQWRRGGLRVHLDQAVTPQWDADTEPVLGVSVPVDRDTLIRRWYVHRVRLDSEGTARRVRIGTEAFARSTEWFGLDECEMTERGLSTPAVERIIRARHTPPPSQWPASKTKKMPAPQARAQALLSRLADVRRLGSVVLVNRVCGEIAVLSGVEHETQTQLTAAVESANRWLEEQTEARRDLFSRLNQAVNSQSTRQVRRLLAHVNAAASRNRTETENAIVDAAAGHLAALARGQQAGAVAGRAVSNGLGAGHERVRNILGNLRRRDADVMTAEMRSLVKVLIRAAADAGDRVTAGQAAEIADWQERAGLDKPVPAAGSLAEARAAAAQRTRNKQDGAGQQKRTRPLSDRVARRFWITRKCPRCHAVKGRNCVNDGRTGTGEVRQVPHSERLKPILEERKAKARQRKRQLRTLDVNCPDCKRPAGAPCASPSGGVHRSRAEHAQELNRKELRS
ncbi:zinc finger domain-containing protein [Streptomyces sp. NPDC001939]